MINKIPFTQGIKQPITGPVLYHTGLMATLTLPYGLLLNRTIHIQDQYKTCAILIHTILELTVLNPLHTRTVLNRTHAVPEPTLTKLYLYLTNLYWPLFYHTDPYCTVPNRTRTDLKCKVPHHTGPLPYHTVLCWPIPYWSRQNLRTRPITYRTGMG